MEDPIQDKMKGFQIKKTNSQEIRMIDILKSSRNSLGINKKEMFRGREAKESLRKKKGSLNKRRLKNPSKRKAAH
jgi:hypothetical protein